MPFPGTRGVGRSSAYGDILIGADGIRSVRDITLVIAFLLIRVQSVRRSFIPDHKLRFSGEVFIRRMFDASLVEGKIPGLPADSIHWVYSHCVEGVRIIANNNDSGALKTTSLRLGLLSGRISISCLNSSDKTQARTSTPPLKHTMTRAQQRRWRNAFCGKFGSVEFLEGHTRYTPN